MEKTKELLLRTNCQTLEIKLAEGSLNWNAITRFRTGQCLNDDGVHYYLKLLEKSCNIHNFWLLDSYFYEKLQTDQHNGYHQVLRYSQRAQIDFFNLKKIIIPINKIGLHWSLIVVNFSNFDVNFSWFDSLPCMYTHNERKIIVEEINGFLQAEQRQRNHFKFNFNFNTYTMVPVPVQLPGSNDCGIFLAHFARCEMFNTDLWDFEPSESSENRIKMLAQIISEHLL